VWMHAVSAGRFVDRIADAISAGRSGISVAGILTIAVLALLAFEGLRMVATGFVGLFGQRTPDRPGGVAQVPGGDPRESRDGPGAPCSSQLGSPGAAGRDALHAAGNGGVPSDQDMAARIARAFYRLSPASASRRSRLNYPAAYSAARAAVSASP